VFRDDLRLTQRVKDTIYELATFMLEGMITVITGASAGFGEVAAKKFVREGWNVIGTGRRKERLGKLKNELGKSFYPLAFDVGDRKAVERAIAELPSGWHEVDVLVNNAGGAIGLDPAQEANLDDWDAMIDSNVKGLVYCTRLILPGMIARGRGTIINLGSVAAEFPYPGGNVYGAAKAFVHQFSLNLRADLIGTPIRVTDIQPGLVGGTEFSEVRFKGDKKRSAAVYEGAEALTPEDVVDAIYWVVTRPAHVNINSLQMMPVRQAFAGPVVKRKGQ
jgi:3-hydroxy acid dehydrogenase/malonic semialdehyde reductase